MSSSVKNQRGFTLLELMVVIVILGVLASLVIPNLMGNKDKADNQKAVSDLVALENALDMYRLDNGRYPTTRQGLDALVKQPDAEPVPREYRNGGYIRRLPQDPWGNNYAYDNPGSNLPLKLYSAGMDGEKGTQDDVTLLDDMYPAGNP